MEPSISTTPWKLQGEKNKKKQQKKKKTARESIGAALAASCRSFQPQSFHTGSNAKTRQRASDLRYVKVEVQRFPRQRLGGAVPGAAHVLVGQLAVRRRGLHQAGRARNHQLQDVQRFPPMGSLSSTHDMNTHTHAQTQGQSYAQPGQLNTSACLETNTR